MTGELRHHAALQPGARLHWYDITSVLGQGGFGITYLARDLNLARDVAIKEFLPTDLAMRGTDGTVLPLSTTHEDSYGWGLERFIYEAKTLVQFRQANIVQVLAVFEANNTAYMVMEYLEGETLDSALKFGRISTEAELRTITMALLDGLESMHAAGFIHRDIKPENIYLRQGNDPVLIDFGSARLAVGVKTRTLTALVTPGYAPYEQYDSSQDVDKQGPWTDVYSLGATLYRAIVGSGPPDAMARVNAVLNGSDVYCPLSQMHCKGFSPEFLAAVDFALAFKPEDRPRSIRQWRACFGTGEFVAASSKVVTGQSNEPETVIAAEQSLPVAKRASPSPSFWTWGVASVLVSVCLWVVYVNFHVTDKEPSAGVDLTVAAVESEPAPLPVAEAIAPPDPENEAGPVPVDNSGAPVETPSAEVAQEATGSEAPIVEEVVPPDSIVAEQASEPDAVAEPPSVEEQLLVPDPPRAETQLDAPVLAAADEEGVAVTDLTETGIVPDETSPDQKVATLLVLARKDLRADRLTSPRGYNAWEKYERVLELDASNVEARTGFILIAQRYVALANKGTEKRDFDLAERYLSKAEDILPGAPVVASARAYLEATRATEVEHEAIPPETRAGEVVQEKSGTRSIDKSSVLAEGRPPYTLALLRFGSPTSIANFDGRLAQEVQRSLVKRSDFVLSQSYYSEGTFRENPINQADFWDQSAGRDKTPNLQGLLAYTDHLGVDGVGLCWWQSGVNEGNPEVSKVTVFLIDVQNRQLYQAKGRWADIDLLVDDVANQFIAGRLPVG